MAVSTVVSDQSGQVGFGRTSLNEKVIMGITPSSLLERRAPDALAQRGAQ